MYLRLVEKDKKYKGKSWKEARVSHLLECLQKQVDKLDKNGLKRKVIGRHQIAKRAADVANFAMMIADVCGGL